MELQILKVDLILLLFPLLSEYLWLSAMLQLCSSSASTGINFHMGKLMNNLPFSLQRPVLTRKQHFSPNAYYQQELYSFICPWFGQLYAIVFRLAKAFCVGECNSQQSVLIKICA